MDRRLSLPATLWRALTTAYGRRGAGTAGAAGAIVQIGLFALRGSRFDPLFDTAQLVLMGMLVPAATLLTGLAYSPPKPDVLSELLRSGSGKAEPFLLGQAAMLYQSAAPGAGRREAVKAIKELITEINRGRREMDYLHTVRKGILAHSVWAICGQKSPKAAESFWDANIRSKKLGHHIERIFFPPASPQEADDTHRAIQLHLENDMTVRLFNRHFRPHDAHVTWKLPSGFGMTLMGAHDAAGRVTIACVLVHWGQITEETHRGVLLEHPLWTAHFWELFEQIAASTEPWTGGNDFGALLERYPEYRARPSGAAGAAIL